MKASDRIQRLLRQKPVKVTGMDFVHVQPGQIHLDVHFLMAPFLVNDPLPLLGKTPFSSIRITDAATGSEAPIRKMSWIIDGAQKIQCSSLNGQAAADLLKGSFGKKFITIDTSEQKIYWTDSDWGCILKADLDGSHEEKVVDGLEKVMGIALDIANGKIYWADAGSRKIQRANLDGSGLESLISNLNQPTGIALDVSGNKIYWADAGSKKIQRARLDGAKIEDLVVNLNMPSDVALELPQGMIYWTDTGAGKIQRATVKGKNVENLAQNLRNPIGLEIADGQVFWADPEEQAIMRWSPGQRKAEKLIDGLPEPHGLAIDFSGGKVYWAQPLTNEIRQADLNGENIQTAVAGPKTPRIFALDIPGNKIYWSSPSTGEIQRSNLDGSSVESLVEGLHAPWGIALDTVNGKLYWTDAGTGKIQCSLLDGSNIEDLVSGETMAPIGIALDVANETLYWTDIREGSINRSNLDGSGPEILATPDRAVPINIAVTNGHLYWTEIGEGRIQRSNLDGNNIESLIEGLPMPWGITLNDIAGREKIYWTDVRANQVLRANLDGSQLEELRQLPGAPVCIALDISGEQVYWSLLEGMDVLRLHTGFRGGFGPHRLIFDDPRIDPYFNNISFSFKAECPSDLDCEPLEHECPPEEIVDFPVDYLARDFWSYRRALLDFAAQRYPDWKDRLEADGGIMLAEVMSALGDEMAYYQDRIGREAFLESATQRRSLRSHVKLIDYTIHDGLGAFVWLDVDSESNVDIPIPAGMDVCALSDNGAKITFEVGKGLEEKINGVEYKVIPEKTTFEPHIWDEDDVCLPIGATSIYVKNPDNYDLKFDDSLDSDNPGIFMILNSNYRDPSRKNRSVLIRVTDIVKSTDSLAEGEGQNILKLTWGKDQALPFELDLTQLEVRGNIIPATAGETKPAYFSIGQVSEEDLPQELQDEKMVPIPAIERMGREGSVTYLFSLPGSEEESLVWLGAEPTKAKPEVWLEEFSGKKWEWKRSFLGTNSSYAEDFHYVLDDGTWKRVVGFQRMGEEIVHYDYASNEGVSIRFGDGEFGRIPEKGTIFKVYYRLGGGAKSNVVEHSLTRIELGGVKVTNPLPAFNGTEPELPEQVRQLAQEAFRAVAYRTVRPEDYAEAAERLPWVQRAGASFRWTGSWLAAFVTPDPRGSVFLSDNQRIDLTNQMDRFRQAGREAHVLEPIYADIDLKITVCAKPDAYRGEVKEQVLLALFGKSGVHPRPGFFSPDRFTFGTILNCSSLEAAIQSVPGVLAVRRILMRRKGWFDWQVFQEPFYDPGKDAIIRIENDLLHPERGILTIKMQGGA